jgi:RNA polymerase sigma-70 factor (ECF subfamily)
MGTPTGRSYADVDDPTQWADRYADSLYAFALARIKHPELAEDLVQETFLAGLAALAAFRGESSLLTWLTGILRRKIADELRARRRSPLQQDSPGCAPSSRFFDRQRKWSPKIRAWRVDPQEIAQSREFWKTLDSCIDQLPATLAAAFRLRHVDGLKSPEVCAALQISDGNFSVRMHRARLSLRECLDRNWFFPSAPGLS